MTGYTVEQVAWRDKMAQLRAIRYTVFVEEQRVPVAEEWDGRDENAIHVLAVTAAALPVGTARLLDTGQIGRMAVLHEHRRQGIGSAMLLRLIGIASDNRLSDVFLNAQIEAVGFYQSHGFVGTGPTFMEAGIVHRKMVLR